MTDPDTYPTAEEDSLGYDDELGYDDDVQDAEEWRPGTCDQCPGHTGGQDEIRAAMASAIVPVCACAIGQGATADECECGPEVGREHTLFEREQLPDNFAELVDELSQPIVSDNGVVIPPAMSPVPPTGEPCGKCGEPPAAHAGWAKGHLWIRRMAYQDAPEVQPQNAADATDGTN